MSSILQLVVSCALQALEAATWAGLLKSPRAVLAGDHLQLPPTVISEEAMHKVSSSCVQQLLSSNSLQFGAALQDPQPLSPDTMLAVSFWLNAIMRQRLTLHTCSGCVHVMPQC